MSFKFIMYSNTIAEIYVINLEFLIKKITIETSYKQMI